jgi:hypothetical protein
MHNIEAKNLIKNEVEKLPSARPFNSQHNKRTAILFGE